VIEMGGDLGWSRRLADHMEDGQETDKALRRYEAGEVKRPRGPAAYAIGWALNSCGLKWCSGPVALLAAGHTDRFFRVLAALSATEDITDRYAAYRFAFATSQAEPKAWEQRLRSATFGQDQHELNVKQKEWLEHLRDIHDRARTELEIAASQRTAIDKAWDASVTRVSRASPQFALASEIVSSTACSESVRLVGALTVLRNAGLESLRTDENALISRLAPIPPNMLEDEPEALYEDFSAAYAGQFLEQVKKLT